MKKNLQKGFTLIELLVVIAIIGILSAVVLASLSTARSKANDAKIKGQLSSIRSAAEIFYSTNNNYGSTTTTSCTGGIYGDTPSGMTSLSADSNYPAGTTRKCGATSSAWAVEAQLSSGSGFFCVDSTGIATTTTATSINPNSDLTCGS